MSCVSSFCVMSSRTVWAFTCPVTKVLRGARCHLLRREVVIGWESSMLNCTCQCDPFEGEDKQQGDVFVAVVFGFLVVNGADSV